MEFKEKQSQIILKCCPVCPKHHNDQKDNMYTFNIMKSTGIYHCFRCQDSGSWQSFKQKMIQGHISTYDEFSQKDQQKNNPNDKVAQICYQQLQDKKYNQHMEYLINKRKIKFDVLQAYKVGMGEFSFYDDDHQLKDFTCIMFPMFRPRSKKDITTLEKEQITFQSQQVNTKNFILSKYKIRGLENKANQRQEPTNANWGIFGLNLINDHHEEVVITEGEFDAMSVYQETGIPAVSLPYGANNLPQELVFFLQNKKKIYLWMDADEAGQMNVQKFIQKLGADRTRIVKTKKVEQDGPKDCNDALQQGYDIKTFIENSESIFDSDFVRFKDLKERVFYRFQNAQQNKGIPSTQFEWFNNTFKGFRMQEFSIYSGGTGSGKSTFISQLALDFAKQGVRTLVGSFEIRNEVLLETQMLQYSNIDFRQQNNQHLFEQYSQQFEQLPLWYFNAHGSVELEKLFLILDFAIESLDISHIILDNLQFMLSGQSYGNKKFDLQDIVIQKLRQIATNKHIHISLVIHPRKVEEHRELDLASFYGSGKATQEADNIVIIQNKQGFRQIQMKKNRYDGECQNMNVGFNRSDKTFFELQQNELISLQAGSRSIDEIVDNRIQKGLPIRKQIQNDQNFTQINSMNQINKIQQNETLFNKNQSQKIHKIQNKINMDNIISQQNNLNDFINKNITKSNQDQNDYQITIDKNVTNFIEQNQYQLDDDLKENINNLNNKKIDKQIEEKIKQPKKLVTGISKNFGRKLKAGSSITIQNENINEQIKDNKQKKKTDFGLNTQYKDENYVSMDKKQILDVLNQNFIYKEYLDKQQCILISDMDLFSDQD